MSQKRKNNEPDFLQKFVAALFRAVLFVITLPFRKVKNNKLTTGEKNSFIKKRFEIEQFLDSTSEIELRHALLEADKLVDHIMKAQHYTGETFADRLKVAQKNISRNLADNIWSGHKVRNRVVHETDTKISAQELKAAIRNLLNYTKNIN